MSKYKTPLYNWTTLSYTGQALKLPKSEQQKIKAARTSEQNRLLETINNERSLLPNHSQLKALMKVQIGLDNWRDAAACIGKPVEAFFPKCADDILPAKQICATCSVHEQCLDFAMVIKNTSGIWGGTTEQERKKLRKSTRKK